MGKAFAFGDVVKCSDTGLRQIFINERSYPRAARRFLATLNNDGIRRPVSPVAARRVLTILIAGV